MALSHVLELYQAPDGSPVYIRCAGMRRAVGMEGASHAHVPDYQEIASKRKAAQLDVRLARVSRIRASDELGYERLLTRPRGTFSEICDLT